MPEVEPTDQRARAATGSYQESKTATKSSSAPLQKHSLGGCSIDIPPSNCYRRRGHIVSPRDTSFYFIVLLYTCGRAGGRLRET